MRNRKDGGPAPDRWTLHFCAQVALATQGCSSILHEKSKGWWTLSGSVDPTFLRAGSFSDPDSLGQGCSSILHEKSKGWWTLFGSVDPTFLRAGGFSDPASLGQGCSSILHEKSQGWWTLHFCAQANYAELPGAAIRRTPCC